MGHTPGPWKFDKEYGNAMDEVYGPDGRAIAAVWTRKSASGSHSRADYSPFEQGTANAHLIAAAPDLLEAMDRLWKMIPWVTNAAKTNDIDALRRIALAYAEWNNTVAMPAVAKAKGE